MSTVVAGWTRSFLSYVEHRGLSADTLLHRVGASRERLASVDARFPDEVDSAMWRLARAELGDDRLGLDFARRSVSDTTLGVLGLLAHASGSVKEATEAVVAHYPLIKDDGFATLNTYEGESTFRIMRDVSHSRWMPETEDAIVATAVGLLRSWAGSDIAPVCIRLQRPRPSHAALWEEYFGCPVTYGNDAAEIVASRDVMMRPVDRSAPEYTRYFAIAARVLLRELGRMQPLEERVIAAIGAAGADLAAVARELGVSARTLQRQLNGRHARFQSLVDEHRRRRVAVLMQDPDITSAEIAARSGFADARSLRRAIRRWATRGQLDSSRPGEGVLPI